MHKRINAASIAVSLTLSAVLLAAISPFYAPFSGHTLAVLILASSAALSARYASQEVSQ